ncbi:hypothetical protein F3Y22_tig00116937pilonHSYRG00068 [Hibiscus syriacus]|uniref:Uncharacterized protein n=1 Tax=Hibiscus syriacus TaxID=106335 RepID=A0A6A2Y0V3_HIBSY|nr:hypothetical protein F3Y22_tig00116937pilonHSYRG00068 [Hibiscus syriacus]
MATVCSSRQVEDRLQEGGLGEIKTKVMGGRDYLLQIDDEELYRVLKEKKWSFLNEVFQEVQPCSESYRASERVTWIKLFGVPLHCWNHNTFKRIAQQKGKMHCDGRKRSPRIWMRGDGVVIIDFESLAGRTVDSSKEKEAERNYEDEDSQLWCMGNLSRGSFLSGEDGEERNIGEETIMGLGNNVASSVKDQTHNEMAVEHEEVQYHAKRETEAINEKIGMYARRNEEIEDYSKELPILDGRMEPMVIEDLFNMGFTNTCVSKSPMGDEFHQNEAGVDQRQMNEAKETLHVGKELGIVFKGSEEALIQEFVADLEERFWCDDDYDFRFSKAVGNAGGIGRCDGVSKFEDSKFHGLYEGRIVELQEVLWRLKFDHIGLP